MKMTKAHKLTRLNSLKRFFGLSNIFASQRGMQRYSRIPTRKTTTCMLVVRNCILGKILSTI